MTGKKLYRILEQIVLQKPQLAGEIKTLVLAVRGADSVDGVLSDYLEKHPALAEAFGEWREPAGRPAGRVFPVHQPFTDQIRQRMKLAERDEHLRNWANAVKAVPEYTLPVPEVDGAFIRTAGEIWHRHIFGNESVLRSILRHSAEYSRTGKTAPILLVGDPGVGKTLAARNYGRILGLPASFISAPAASSGRGLSGAPNVYVGAGAGAIVQAMIEHRAGNPVICIDEIDKASGGPGRTPAFEDELLSALDESGASWYDNFLEIAVDASHIPFVFTANSRESIPPPLLDRMEVIRMDPPTLETVHGIVRRFTLPRAVGAYGGGRIEFREHEAELLVDLLWKNGCRGCRTYQKAIDYLAGSAFLEAVEQGRTVRVTEKDVRDAAEAFAREWKKPVGFSA